MNWDYCDTLASLLVTIGQVVETVVVSTFYVSDSRMVDYY